MSKIILRPEIVYIQKHISDLQSIRSLLKRLNVLVDNPPETVSAAVTYVDAMTTLIDLRIESMETACKADLEVKNENHDW